MKNQFVAGIFKEDITANDGHIARVGNGDVTVERLIVVGSVVAVARLRVVNHQRIDVHLRRIQFHRFGLSDSVVTEDNFHFDDSTMVGWSHIIHLEKEIVGR